MTFICTDRSTIYCTLCEYTVLHASITFSSPYIAKSWLSITNSPHNFRRVELKRGTNPNPNRGTEPLDSPRWELPIPPSRVPRILRVLHTRDILDTPTRISIVSRAFSGSIESTKGIRCIEISLSTRNSRRYIASILSMRASYSLVYMRALLWNYQTIEIRFLFDTSEFLRWLFKSHFTSSIHELEIGRMPKRRRDWRMKLALKY